ncbi:MbeD/MobD family mobilization/exclusion protein, partial [Klebsiella pneumoniae]|nr:hypothetical protein [Enterobacter hormaechei subsp. xiangfangensis]
MTELEKQLLSALEQLQ